MTDAVIETFLTIEHSVNPTIHGVRQYTGVRTRDVLTEGHRLYEEGMGEHARSGELLGVDGGGEERAPRIPISNRFVQVSSSSSSAELSCEDAKCSLRHVACLRRRRQLGHQRETGALHAACGHTQHREACRRRVRTRVTTSSLESEGDGTPGPGPWGSGCFTLSGTADSGQPVSAVESATAHVD